MTVVDGKTVTKHDDHENETISYRSQQNMLFTYLHVQYSTTLGGLSYNAQKYYKQNTQDILEVPINAQASTIDDLISSSSRRNATMHILQKCTVHL